MGPDYDTHSNFETYLRPGLAYRLPRENGGSLRWGTYTKFPTLGILLTLSD